MLMIVCEEEQSIVLFSHLQQNVCSKKDTIAIALMSNTFNLQICNLNTFINENGKLNIFLYLNCTMVQMSMYIGRAQNS